MTSNDLNIPDLYIPPTQSHDDRTDDDSPDDEDFNRNENTPQSAKPLNKLNGDNMFFNDNVSPEELNSSQTEEVDLRHHQLSPNHPLNRFGGFMANSGLHSIPNLPHSDVLEKLKMQVRDIKVGLMDQDYMNAAFAAHVLPTSMNSPFSLPTPAIPSFAHNAPGMAALQQTPSDMSNGSAGCVNGTTTNGGVSSNSGVGGGGGTAGNGSGSVNATGPHNFSFTSPTAPNAKEVNSASNSSTSSEASSSSIPNNSWSFEEQYKQVRQLYEINDDPKRKELLDDLFSFMQKRGSPISRLPIMAKSVLDLYELYNLVIERGGLVDVINKKLWQEIIKGLHLPSSITSAAFTLRTQYMKYLYPYECEKKNLSTPNELQAAIDGNRREGRRSSYGQYDSMQHHMPMAQMSRQLPGGIQQISPLALVSQAAAANNQAAAAAAAAAAHRRLMGTPGFGPNIMEYIQLLQSKQEQNLMGGGGCANNALESHQQRQSQSPDTRDAINALKMSHVALWQMYNSNPPAISAITDQQRASPLNLSDSLPNSQVKREHSQAESPVPSEDCHDQEQDHLPPPNKRVGNPALLSPAAFPPNFYLNQQNMAAAAASLRRRSSRINHSDVCSEPDADDDFGNGATAPSAHDDSQARQLNGSDDSAFEKSPSTISAGSGGVAMVSNGACSSNNRDISPLSSKTNNNANKEHKQNLNTNNNDNGNSMNHQTPIEALKLLSNLQFQVLHNGTAANGAKQLEVNLQVNGVQYSGLLVEKISKLEIKEININDKIDSSSSTDTSSHDLSVGYLNIDESSFSKPTDEQDQSTQKSTLKTNARDPKTTPDTT